MPTAKTKTAKLNKKKITAAFEAYEALRLAVSQERNHSKIMVSLPIKKEEKYRRLLGIAKMHSFNARAEYNNLLRDLTDEEMLALIERINENYV